MLLWKGDHSSIRSANWFVPSSNSTNSVKEEQLNRDRHRGQGGEQHCPFCRQPDLDYIPVKFGYTCGSGSTGLSLWTEAIYVTLGATESPEPHSDNCYTNNDSHQWVTSLLPPLWLAPFGNGLVKRRAVQSSQNTGCKYFLTFPSLQAATVQNTIHLILMGVVKVRLIMMNSWAPIHVLHSPWITPVTFTTSRKDLYHVLLPFALWALPSPPEALLGSSTLSKAQHGQQAPTAMLSCSRSPPCSTHRHNLYLNLNSSVATQTLNAMPSTWSMGAHQEHPLKGPS